MDLNRMTDEMICKAGPSAVLRATAERLKIEAAIAHGEGREQDGRKWEAFADQVFDLAEDVPEMKD